MDLFYLCAFGIEIKLNIKGCCRFYLEKMRRIHGFKSLWTCLLVSCEREFKRKNLNFFVNRHSYRTILFLSRLTVNLTTSIVPGAVIAWLVGGWVVGWLVGW